MTKVPPPTDITLWDDFRHVQTRVAQALTAALRTQADLTLGEYQVLAKLAEAPGGGRRLMDLADPLGFSPSGLTQVINRLEAAGFVRRAMAADDRRGIAAVLTRAGRGRVRRATSVVTATIAEYFTDPLGASGRAVVRRACARILVSRG